MKVVFYILISVYAYIILKNIISLIYLNKLLRENIDKEETREVNNDELVYLIIPLLNEEKIVEYTYINFKKIVEELDNVRILFVTTSKEKNMTTYKILKKLIENDKNMFICNYENTTGVMAHQLNYAVKEIEKKRINNEKIMIGVYNADSKIDSKTIKYVLSKEKNRNKGDKVCYQQYSWYRVNKISKNKGIIPSASLWQTRWSLTFEIFRVKQQEWMYKIYMNINNLPIFKYLNKILYMLLEKMNYIIGHGFYIDIDLLNSIGGFPENTINEDAFLGYVINNENIKIEIIPYLERADFVPTISIYVKQQSTWVNGPVYAFDYFKLYCKNAKMKTTKKIRAFILAAKLFLHFVYWLISPYILIFVIPMLFYNYYSITGLIISLILIFLELPFTHYLVKKVILLNINEEEKCELASPSIYCILFFIVHSFGPIRNLYMQIIGNNKIENKYKTERK